MFPKKLPILKWLIVFCSAVMGLRIYEEKFGANHAACLQRPPQNCYYTSRGPCSEYNNSAIFLFMNFLRILPHQFAIRFDMSILTSLFSTTFLRLVFPTSIVSIIRNFKTCQALQWNLGNAQLEPQQLTCWSILTQSFTVKKPLP